MRVSEALGAKSGPGRRCSVVFVARVIVITLCDSPENRGAFRVCVCVNHYNRGLMLSSLTVSDLACTALHDKLRLMLGSGLDDLLW
jgi:hypothetical protein